MEGFSDQGHNSIYGSRQYDISSAYAGTIFACYNWWGQYPADPVRYGTIDFSNELNYDPNPNINNMSENKEPARLFLKTGNKKTSDEMGIKDFDAARGLFSQKKYSEAESALREVINKYPDKLSGRLALITLNQCLKDDKKEVEREGLLNEIKNMKSDNNLISVSSHLKAKDLKDNGKPESAASELEEIINKNSNFENMPFVLYDLATIKYFTLNDKTAGEKYYNTLIEKYPDEEITKSALAILGKLKPIASPKETAEKKIKIEKTTLLANYPNPFNPATVIKYNLAENTNVTIKVYDVLGREVKTLLNEFKPIGSYEVKFDGTGLSSGLYFYQLKAGNVNQIMKMVLAK